MHVNGELRRRLVACGVSAGCASVFGTPVGGAIYGVEVLAIGRIRHDFLFPAIVAGPEESVIDASDWVIEVRPGAGNEGGRIVRAGPA